MTNGHAYANLEVERREDGVLVVALSRPPVNALGRELTAELAEAAARLGADPSVRAVVVAARGKTFCAGADLKERRGMSEAEVEDTVRRLRGSVEAVAAIPVPTIAAVQGVAAGGGCELALACDLRVVAASARIGLPECTLAIIPGAGATQRLPRLIGPSRAKRWIFTGRLFGAQEALADGVADIVAPDGGALQAALDLAAEIAACGPVAVRSSKRAIEAGLDASSLEEGLALEWECYRTVIPTADRREALAAFAEKRKPVYRGR